MRAHVQPPAQAGSGHRVAACNIAARQDAVRDSSKVDADGPESGGRLDNFIRLVLRRAPTRAFDMDRHGMSPVSKETPRTMLRNFANPRLAAPHHEAGRDRG